MTDKGHMVALVTYSHDEWDGPVMSQGIYFQSVADWLDSLGPNITHPARCYAARPHRPVFDAYRVLEDMGSPGRIKEQADSLQKVLDAWSEQHDIAWYAADYLTVITWRTLPAWSTTSKVLEDT